MTRRKGHTRGAHAAPPARAAHEGGARGGRRARRKRPDRLTLALVIAAVLGLGMFTYPMLANWWNGRHMSDASAQYEQTVETSAKDELADERAAAVAYNKQLVGMADRYHPNSAQMREYLSLLDPSGTGVMGQVIIPKLGLDLPIYHTTENEVLAAGIGHIPGSSLPVGGKSTHCVISGHRAFPNAELFTNIDQLVEGDTFQLQVLGRTLTYEVDQIRIVLPDEVDELAIEKGEDLCTLVTCTPYGVNTHRLLVRGHRVPNTGAVSVNADATRVDQQAVAAVLVVVLLTAAWCGYLGHERLAHGRERARERMRERLGVA